MRCFIKAQTIRAAVAIRFKGLMPDGARSGTAAAGILATVSRGSRMVVAGVESARLAVRHCGGDAKVGKRLCGRYI